MCILALEQARDFDKNRKNSMGTIGGVGHEAAEVSAFLIYW